VPERGDVVWAPDPFKSGSGNPRPWLILAAAGLPYADEEAIAVAFTTQSHHPESFAVPSDAWVRGEPGTESYVLPWSVATLKRDLHVVGTQGAVGEAFVERVVTALRSYLDPGRRDDE